MKPFVSEWGRIVPAIIAVLHGFVGGALAVAVAWWFIFLVAPFIGFYLLCVVGAPRPRCGGSLEENAA